MRRHLRAGLGGLLVGLIAVGSALAGVVTVPAVREGTSSAPTLPSARDVAKIAKLPARASGDIDLELSPREVVEVAGRRVRTPKGGRTPDGTFLVGAARASLTPAPTRFGGKRWSRSGCTSLDDGTFDGDHLLPDVVPDDPIATLEDIRGWPATGPDCIYLGGLGIGPNRYAHGVGHGGVWVRALAISNGQRTVVYAIADVVGWFSRYDLTVCDDCGVLDVRERLAKEMETDIGGLVIGSTHTHAGADTYGGWGGIPRWYRDQIARAATAAVKQSVMNLTPATVSYGETQIRDRNNERRDTYYSTVDTSATWLQARSLQTDDVVATLGTYAAHPTIVERSVLHADWPGAAARSFETRYGGVGVFFEGGLGNASVSSVHRPTDIETAEATGIAIAGDIARNISHDARAIERSEIRTSTQQIVHPVTTNVGLLTLASFGLMDREFLPGTDGAGVPDVYHWSKSGPNGPGYLTGCDSAGPTLKTTAGAHRIGNVLVAFAPGEIFSNISEVVRERADRGNMTMVMGQSNDALGYLIQSFEGDIPGGAVTEYGTQTGEYEEVFAIDRCLGDHVLDAMLTSTAELGFGR